MQKNQIQSTNRGRGLGYSGRGTITNTGKGAKAIAALQTRLEADHPDLELIEDNFALSKASGHCILNWNNVAYGKLTLAQYVKPSEISKVLDELPKWKYVAQSVAHFYEEWQKAQALPDGAMLYWKYPCSSSWEYRDIKCGAFWKREERIGNDWRYVKLIEAPDFRGETSGDRKYYSPSGEEILRSDWNHNRAWFAAVRRWDLNNIN